MTYDTCTVLHTIYANVFASPYLLDVAPEVADETRREATCRGKAEGTKACTCVCCDVSNMCNAAKTAVARANMMSLRPRMQTRIVLKKVFEGSRFQPLEIGLYVSSQFCSFFAGVPDFLYGVLKVGS